MITEIRLQNFKCFGQETTFKFSKINVLYGKNGRGKSTTMQPLLLLSQNARRKDSIINSSLKGAYVDLGNYHDVTNRYMGFAEPIRFEIASDIDEVLKLTFGNSHIGPTMMHLDDAWSGNKHLVSSVGTDQQDSGTVNASGLTGIKVLDSLKQLKYVSANRRGPVNYEERQDDFEKDDIGATGERLINSLAKCDALFIESFQDALSYILSGATIKIFDDKKVDHIDLLLDSNDDSDGFKPSNVGFGYSFVLPVIYQVLSATKGSTIIIENPEAHLYPGAQSRLVEWIVAKANQEDLQIILETHSDHIINGLRISVKKNKLNRNDVMIQFVDRKSEKDTPEVISIKMDQNGTLNENPADFMDEWTKQMLDLL
ncbi:MAG: DUF3696 domain-containing protein [Bacteroidales bacterium]|nr:DUF3696 domain-containing protein [Bacteroidales bacterium]